MFFLDQDNDCHWYIVPVQYRDEWADWLNGAAEDHPPVYATPVDGPHKVVFERWMVG